MFFDTFEKLCNAKGISCKKAVIEIGLSNSIATKWKKTKATPNGETLNKIAAYFSVSVNELLRGENERDAPNSKTKGIRISVLGRVAAGVPLEAVESEIDWEEIPEDWLYGGQEYFGLKVKGDSMYPKYLEGDTVIVRKASDCDNGQDCVVYINGYDATLKTVKRCDDESITLIPYNREYAPKTYTREEICNLPIMICGVVVELRRKI